MSRCRTTLTWIAVIALLLAACSSSTASEPEEPTTQLGSEPVLVLWSDYGVDDVAIAELLGEKLDLLFIGTGDCDRSLSETSTHATATCDMDVLEDAIAATTGRVTVVAAADLDRIVELDADTLAAMHLVSDEAVDSALVSTVSSVTILPSEVRRQFTEVTEGLLGVGPAPGSASALLITLIGLDDTIATFQVGSSDSGRQRTVTSVDVERIEKLFGIETPVPTAVSEPEIEQIPAASVLWTLELDVRPSGLHSQSAVIGPRLFALGFDGTFRAIDREAGTVDWSVQIDDGIGGIHASVVTGDERVVVTNTGASPPPIPDIAGARGVFAFEPATGELLWSFESDQTGFSGHPLLVGDTVYFWFASAPGDSAFQAVDALTGEVGWRHEAPWGAGQPRFHDGVVYAGSSDGTIFGFDAETGDVVFEFFSPEASTAGLGVASRPAAVDRTLYFGTDAGIFHAVDLDSGQELWSFEVGAVNLPSSPAIAGNLVVFGAWDNAVHALNRFTGTPVWTASSDRGVLASPEVSGQTVVVAIGRELRGLALSSGEPLWRHETLDWITDSPAIVDNAIYLQSAGRIEAIANTS